MNLPTIFTYTSYRLPSNNELDEFNNYPDLTVNDIIDGFSYTIVGKGIRSGKKIYNIVLSIYMLHSRFPDNKIYLDALRTATIKYKDSLLHTAKLLVNNLNGNSLMGQTIKNNDLEKGLQMIADYGNDKESANSANKIFGPELVNIAKFFHPFHTWIKETKTIVRTLIRENLNL